MTDVDPRAVELALQQVAGVASATVEPGPGGGTLRLVLEPGADADAVGALVRRRLADRFGLGVDPAAGLPGESGGVPPAPPRDAVDHPALPEAPGSPATVDPGVRGDAPRLAVLPGGRPASPSVAPALAPAATRFRMVAGERDAARIEVSVGAGPREATGAAEAPATIDGLRRAAAEATARAVYDLFA